MQGQGRDLRSGSCQTSDAAVGSPRILANPATWSLLIFTLATALRVPSCYESFWVDELHSAWCVWDGLGEVAPRAQMGHQTPFYFLGLWFWKAIVGSSELTLRLSSVLAGAAACGMLTFGLARATGSLITGVTAGLVLAIENNSIFFGTELRPFAVVMFMSSLATVCFVRLVNTRTRFEAFRWWLTLIAACLIAALIQPTSLGVLAWLPAMLIVVWLRRGPSKLSRFTLADGLTAMATAGVALALWSMTLGDSWQQRADWSSFARTDSLSDLVSIWAWRWLLVVPLGVTCVAWVFGKRSAAHGPESTVVLLGTVAALATTAYWWVSWHEWVPLWHRRYFIAALPMFAAVCGSAVGVVQSRTGLSPLAWLAGVLLVGGLTHHQDLARKLRQYPEPLVERGENWRGAIHWVRTTADENDAIFIDSGLIESRRLVSDQASAFRVPDLYTANGSHYFCYPVLGPYQLRQKVAPISPDLSLPQEVLYDQQKQVFLIVRRPLSRIQIDATKWGWVYGNRKPQRITAFGNVTVLMLSSSGSG